jgi:hypothetical protein
LDVAKANSIKQTFLLDKLVQKRQRKIDTQKALSKNNIANAVLIKNKKKIFRTVETILIGSHVPLLLLSVRIKYDEPFHFHEKARQAKVFLRGLKQRSLVSAG